MTETFTCSHCGEAHPMHQQYTMDDTDICPSCADEETIICIVCGERIWRDDNAGDVDTPLCQHCYAHSYTTCERCNRVIHHDDACYIDDDEDEPLCYECFSRAAKDCVIQDYSYKPQPLFYGNDLRYFGVELEIDQGGESSNNAREILSIANQTADLIYCKHDGSLDDGFEIVTHPMTLEYHCGEMPWKAVIDKAVDLGYLSHKARTCGLHIHVGRSAFGSTEEQQDDCIARILYFFEKHWEELLKFSRRTQRQLDRWAVRYGYKEQPQDILNHAKNGYGGGRYSSINLQNRDTIEFRVFRGTLKYNTLIATLQMVNRLCNVAISMSDEELKALSWTSFVAGITELELLQYLKERQIYVNDAVDSEEEV